MEGSGMPDNIQIICNVTGMSLVLSKWVTTPLQVGYKSLK